MTSLDSQINRAATTNKQLLQTLAETDHAASQLAQQLRLIDDLSAEIAESNTRVVQAEAGRLKEFKDHDKYRDSIFRRFTYKATGKGEKFNENAQKEELEYLDALQTEHREKELNRGLKEQLATVQSAIPNLEQDVARHGQAQRELDQLYAAIFDGPTPGDPEEDQKEQAAKLASAAYQEARGEVEAEATAVCLLGDAQRSMHSAIIAMRDASRVANMDIGTDRSEADKLERSSLNRAETDITSARVSVLQAQRISPRIPSLPQVDIGREELMRDMYFASPGFFGTTTAFHEKVKERADRVNKAAEVLAQIAAETKARHENLETEMEVKERELQDARNSLQEVRKRAFEHIAGV